MSRTLAKACMGFVVAGSAILVHQNVASAADSLASFFSEQFGIGQQAAPSSAPPVWADPDGDERPLVVRPHRRPSRARVAKQVAVIVHEPYKPISIFEDKTLRRGDAVMTAQGIRIFQGGSSLPYRDADFVAVSDTDGLSKNISKALVAIDRLPRG